MRALDQLEGWVRSYIWRETQWLWLQDSLFSGKVVQTTWGDADEWLKFGTHDAHTSTPLNGSPPVYSFSERSGMRWDVLALLLQELFDRRASAEPLFVIELGVFAGTLSQYLLKKLDFIVLVGVDPYIGSDGTFPGNYSQTLDADIAMQQASADFCTDLVVFFSWPHTDRHQAKFQA